MKNHPETSFTGPELCGLNAVQVIELLRKKEISPEELLDASFERINQVEPSINAFPTLCEKRARDSAKNWQKSGRENSNEPGWLGGLPIGIKDLTPVAGVRTTFGTKGLSDFVPKESEPLVINLEKKGALVIGKTNTPEMGAGGNTFNEIFGMTRNPWNTQRNAGGSSGGSAAALATGEVWLSHGNDLAGSLRTPAAYCGVVGFRPSPGIARGGGLELGFSTESVQGPMARNVTDCALFLDSMSGFDSSSPLSYPAPETPYLEAVKRADTNVRIAYSHDLNGFAPLSKEWKHVLMESLKLFEKSGATVEEKCPILPNLNRCYRILRAMVWAAGPGRAPNSVQKHFKQTLSDNIDYGRRLTIDEVYGAQIDRNTIYHNMRQFLSGYDVLACPTVSLEPGPVIEEYPREIDGQPLEDYIEWLRFSFLSTTAGLPAISIPVGFTKSGMPVGLQLIGPPRGEAKVLEVARAIELAVGAMQTPIDPIITN